jgi:NADH-quinone oxidoreductase subunit C
MELLGQAVAAVPGITGWHILHGELIAQAERGPLLSVMMALRDTPALQFEQMMDLCGVDWPDRPERVICPASETTPVPSVHTVWPCATWWEREAWDLFGIIFDGQPDLRRILTDYGFEGHPLRKDFPLTGYTEVRYDDDRKAVVYEPVKLTQDWRSFDFLSPWEGMTTLPGDEKVFTERAKPEGKPA